MELKVKVVLVTGSSMGIGREIAHALAREGCRVVFAARSFDLVQAEAVALLIGARSERAARLAARLVDGALSREVGALREMVLPGLLAVLTPVVVGFSFRYLSSNGQVGAESVAALLMVGTITGILSSGPDDVVWDAALGCNHWYVDPTGAMVAKGAKTAQDALAKARDAAFVRARKPPGRPSPGLPTVNDLASGPSCAGACNGRSPDGCGCDAACGSPVLVVILATEAERRAVAARPRARRER